jgi:hypothetical protein
MTLDVHARVMDRLARLFDRRLIQNDLRGMYVECMVAEILGVSWKSVGENWAAWDLEHEDGTKLEVRQSAARQSWEPPKRGYTSPKFSIRTPSEVWDGAVSVSVDRRQADIYLFAWHEVTSELADHRDVSQWEFFLVPTSALPVQKSLGLVAVKRIAVRATASDLVQITDDLRSRRKQQ